MKNTLDNIGAPVHNRGMKKTTATKSKKRPVIVTTLHRGVFFGYADKIDGETINLTASRVCLYWSADMRGFMGLASIGPSATCKIGAKANIQLRNITSVIEVTKEAEARWLEQ